jgi:hypothetical protein
MQERIRADEIAADGGVFMDSVRDHLWLWGHEAGSHNGHFGITGASQITPTEAARTLGIPNLVMVVFGGRPEPPFAPHALPMRSLTRMVWSIVGDASSTRHDDSPDLEEVIALAAECPNVTGAIMDDFFHRPDGQGAVARYSAQQVAGFRERLHGAPRSLDLWVVLYAHDLELPVGDHLAQSDVVTFWTWESKDLDGLPANFARAEALAPGARKVLGCYLWDYGAQRPMPLEARAHQCETGLDWLREGRLEGMILLASCICDLGLEAVEWTRRWIAEVGDEPLGRR